MRVSRLQACTLLAAAQLVSAAPGVFLPRRPNFSPGTKFLLTNTTPNPITVLPLTAIATGAHGVLFAITTSMAWISSDIPTTTTINDLAVQSTTPVWFCTGELCNPACEQSDLCDNSGDGGVGPFRFPWPCPPDITLFRDVVTPTSTGFIPGSTSSANVLTFERSFSGGGGGGGGRR